MGSQQGLSEGVVAGASPQPPRARDPVGASVLGSRRSRTLQQKYDEGRLAGATARHIHGRCLE